MKNSIWEKILKGNIYINLKIYSKVVYLILNLEL